MLKIGNVTLASKVILAPMAGITNTAYRKIYRKYMKGLICSEMVSDKGLYYQNKKTLKMIEVSEAEGLVSLQIFGGEKESIIRAAKFVDENSSCAIIDLNMGCPVKKVLKTGGGANLLKDPDYIYEIVKNVVNNVKKPVSVKIRLGFDHNSLNYLEVGKLIEQAGASAIILHARTRNQFYGGQADYSHIKLLKEHVSIPVIGNGDINSVADAIRMLEETNCDGIMIGRASLGNPWLVQEIEHYLEHQEYLEKPSVEEIIQQAIEHLEVLVVESNEKIGVIQMRGLGAWYLKGLKDNAITRRKLNKANSKEEMINIFNDYLSYLQTASLE